jgi:hypothetical protein
MKVDILQWLHDTGGNNAIKRFSTDTINQQTQQSAQSNQQPAAKVTLSKNDVATLKASMQYNRAAQIVGFSGGNVINLSSLASTTALPAAPVKATAETNRTSFNPEPKSTNTANVSGKNNMVDFTSSYGRATNNNVTVTGNRNMVRGYNGGQTANSISIKGNTNTLMAGEATVKNTISVQGQNNAINLGSNASSNTLVVKGNNVSISMGSQATGAANSQGWNIDVNANNVNVQIVNGTATVNVAEEDKNKYSISINNETKSISVASVNPTA